MPYLVSFTGTRFPLQRGEEYVVGRGAETDIVLEDAACSRRHARLVVSRARDEVLLEDLDSHNGTLVDGVRVDGRVLLAEGSRLQIGQTVFLVHLADAEDEPETGTFAFGEVVQDKDAGELAEVGFLPLLRRLHEECRNVTLRIALPDGRGTVEIRDGEVVAAEHDGLEGFNALVRIGRENAGIYWMSEAADACEANVSERMPKLADEVARCVGPAHAARDG